MEDDASVDYEEVNSLFHKEDSEFSDSFETESSKISKSQLINMKDDHTTHA